MMDGISSSMAMSTDMMAQRQEQMFARVDQNSDGKLDETEMQVMADKMSERTGIDMDFAEIMATFDTDGDGSINQEEFKAMRPPQPPPDMSETFAQSYSADAQRIQTSDMSGTLLDLLS